ncbi:MAG TPA: glycosyltransferase family 2 protein [Acidimicrobiia bacterium]
MTLDPAVVLVLAVHRDTRPVPPRVSLVVPVYNGMPYLKELTASLLAQTFSDLEIIFSDGGSTDGSVEFLRTVSDERVTVIDIPAGSGAAANWTAATNAARGEFTKLICQDDLLYPHAIAEQVQDLDANPEAVMAVATRDIIDARSKVLYRGRGLAGIDRERASISGLAALRACYLAGTNVLGEPLAVLFRTKALQSQMPWSDDNPLMLDLSLYQKVAPLGDVVLRRSPVGAFRVSDASWSTRLASSQAEQTRRWQEAYAAGAVPPLSTRDRRVSAWGRRRQITTRRIAYTVLRLRGSLRTKG